MDNNTLQEQIIYLKNQLVVAKLELTCARRSEEMMKFELTKMRSTVANRDIVNPPPSAALRATVDANGAVGTRKTRQYTAGDKISVPTASGRRSSMKKSLNPSSCSSGIYLMGLGRLPTSSSLYRLKKAGSSYRSKQNLSSTLTSARKDVERPKLNPNSCASGLHLCTEIHDLQEDLQSLRRKNASSVSILSMGSANNLDRLVSAASTTRPRKSDNQALQVQPGITCNSLLSMGSANNLVFLLGNTRSQPSSSMSRTRMHVNANISNGNATWDL